MKIIKHSIKNYTGLSIRQTVDFCFYLLVFSVLLSSCAQIVAPTGGKKDELPPVAKKYSPDSAALNFNARKITITFDEFIQLRDLNSQLIISPPLEFAPEVKAKNNELIIELDKSEKLKPNTTYSISFGNAIQDIHEGKATDNFKYVFSTGSSIDSLSVKGRVQTSFDQKVEKGVIVMLYSTDNDSVIYKSMPDYFAKTREDGSFDIRHIRSGKYKVMALKDANANYKYDSEAESVAFADTMINVTRNASLSLNTFLQPAKKLFLKFSIHSYYGRIMLVFNKPAEDMTIRPINQTLNEKDVFVEFSKNKDTVNYWFRNPEKDSLVLQINNNGQSIDTVSFKAIKKEDALKNNRTPLKFKLLSSPDKNQNFDLHAELLLTFSHPIDPVSVEDLKGKEIKLLADSLPYEGYTDLVYRQKNNTTLVISKKSAKGDLSLPALKENTKYQLFVPPGTFTDIFGLTNDSINIGFKTREEKQYGTLKLKLDVPETKANYIVQLLDEKENVIREQSLKKSETINYQYLLPRKYRLKIIVDNNSNGKWDTGNLQKKQQPEKVVYNSELITTRPNWDFELEWKVSL